MLGIEGEGEGFGSVTERSAIRKGSAQAQRAWVQIKPEASDRLHGGGLHLHRLERPVAGGAAGARRMAAEVGGVQPLFESIKGVVVPRDIVAGGGVEVWGAKSEAESVEPVLVI